MSCTDSVDVVDSDGGFELYCTTHDRFPLRLVDVSELFLRQLRERGIRQRWFSNGRDAPGPWREETVEGVPVVVAPSPANLGGLGRSLERLLEWVCDNLGMLGLLWRRVDVIQVRDKYWINLVAWCVARLSGAKYVVWLSFPFPEAEIDRSKRFHAARRWYLMLSGRLGEILLYRIGMRHADHCFVQTEEMKRSLLRYGIPAERMTPVPMGVTPRVLVRAQRSGPPASRPEGLPDGRLIVYLGTLDQDRELTIMVDAMALVLPQEPQARLLLIGGETYATDRLVLEERARMLGIESSLSFTGQLPIEEAWALLEHAEVCLCPVLANRVLRVGSPTKLIEYMAFAKPVVANEHPEHRKVLDESGAGLCVPWSAEGFAQGILQLLADPEAASAMGRRGPPWVMSNRSYDLIADAVMRQYLRVLGRDGSTGREEALPN